MSGSAVIDAGTSRPPARGNYNYSGMEAKFAVLERFFTGHF